MNINHPILYSFRRCPYAMRARLAIVKSIHTVELREVILRDKPQQLIDISPKATVPFLLLNNGTILDESLDIMFWALSGQSDSFSQEMTQLIQWNDGEFKYYLDRYKYADRYPEHDKQSYREKAAVFLLALEKRLSQHTFLCGESDSIADLAIFPFIRQFANVDPGWFHSSEYKKLISWLKTHIESSEFISIMDKYSPWKPENEKLLFNVSKRSSTATSKFD